jgi:hypothetical protein
MQLERFRALIRRLSHEIPEEYLRGVASVEVSERSVPHPSRPGVYTLGECIPLDPAGDAPVSRIVLYHGSFAALAEERPGFDWRGEAWETLLHELRHHIEWQAGAARLEDFDWAAEQNFARQEGGPFDPDFYRSGERVGEGVFRIDDDVFIERVVKARPEALEVAWDDRVYGVPVPPEPLPLYLVLEGVAHPPEGDLIVVIREPATWRDLFRRARPVTTREVRAVATPPS